MATTTAHTPPARSGRACRCAACSASSPTPTRATARATQLGLLDDHLLRDMGITRADRDAEVRRTFDW